MSYYFQDINDVVEDWTVKLFNKYLGEQYNTARNNLSSNDIDIAISTPNHGILKVDAQYSFNFFKYGDVRIDLISAGFRRPGWENYSVKELNSFLYNSYNPFNEINNIFDIRKYGKYFEHNNMTGVFYFLYNQPKPKGLTVEEYKKIKIDKLIYLPKNIILQEIYNPTIKHDYKINDKSKYGLIEKHDSAFVCLKLNEICKNYNIPIFSNKAELENLKFIFERNLSIQLDNNKINI